MVRVGDIVRGSGMGDTARRGQELGKLLGGLRCGTVTEWETQHGEGGG